MNITDYFLSLAALVPLVVLISDFIIRGLNIQKAFVKQIISWVIAVVACLVGMWFDLGMFVDLSIWKTLAYGLATGLIANGIFDITIVQTILNFLFKFLPKKPE